MRSTHETPRGRLRLVALSLDLHLPRPTFTLSCADSPPSLLCPFSIAVLHIGMWMHEHGVPMKKLSVNGLRQGVGLSTFMPISFTQSIAKKTLNSEIEKAVKAQNVSGLVRGLPVALWLWHLAAALWLWHLATALDCSVWLRHLTAVLWLHRFAAAPCCSARAWLATPKISPEPTPRQPLAASMDELRKRYLVFLCGGGSYTAHKFPVTLQGRRTQLYLDESQGFYYHADEHDGVRRGGRWTGRHKVLAAHPLPPALKL